MGRPRSFDTASVVDAASAAFRGLGYEATSVDDLVAATGLHRGSLYSAFGSKRSLFLAALRHLVEVELPAALARGPQELVDGPGLDLLLVAALELAPRDEAARDLVDAACAVLTPTPPDHAAPGPGVLPEQAAALLGRRLLARAGVPTQTDQQRGS